MTVDSYLQMVDGIIKETKEAMELAEKEYRQAKSKYESVVRQRELYLEWVGDSNETK